MSARRAVQLLITILVGFVLLGLIGSPAPAQAQTPTPGYPVYIYLFWGDGCPHCARAKPYFEGLQDQYPGVVLRSFEIYYNSDNQQLFNAMAQKYGLTQLGVPTIFLGPYYLQGYTEEYNPDIEKVVLECLEKGCEDPAAGIEGVPTLSPTPTTILIATTTPTPTPLALMTPTIQNPTESPGNLNQNQTLEIPLIGTIDLASQSITLSTILIAFVDGFNPCSLWVLSMLLAITLHTGSRKKVLAIGLIFLTVTAAIYALFIGGLFSVLSLISFMGWVQVLVALVALFFALVNIKDYFWYKEGLSLTISDEKKPGIFKRIRAVMDASQSFWGLAGATIVLAAGVSLVEFSCTAGFPVLWVNLLTAQKISGTTFIWLLLLYMLIYQLDELAVFSTAVFTLKSSRMEEKHGRVLKLIGGMLMLTLAGVMLINPTLMNNLSNTLIIFGIALLATLLVLFTHRVLLPRLGIYIGTEYKAKDSAKPTNTKP